MDYIIKNKKNNLEVFYNNIKLNYDEQRTVENTINKPTLIIPLHNYYTIIMVDPDAPSSTNPIYRYWLHWLIINNDDTIILYNGPSPPKGSGNHRYFILLFYHNNRLNKNNIIKEITERKKFNLMNFIEIYNLNLICYTKFNVIG